MEDVLDVYQRPTDPARRVVCLDETSRQLLGETRPPEPVAPGKPARHDAEYVRGGVANLFLVCEPLRGWHCIKELVDVHYPDADRIVLVMDQLNSHSPAAL